MLSHKNIIQFYGAVIEPPNYGIVTGELQNLALNIQASVMALLHGWISLSVMVSVLSDFYSFCFVQKALKMLSHKLFLCKKKTLFLAQAFPPHNFGHFFLLL